ncbi:hypothetical protein LOH54_03735 [Sulfurimonas sp. HSL-3221]|uniref:hypothetical protein n=1 Tax=Sulfurimonadaceae TaxID=2771471 RepID=UPI001E6295E1|nr:hypothetical protein [Sulfurimonas sp. HSL-3221]UFS63244.1 hypothetical protein LOH54_03735 [Sulfurimonas sp. HSL-3221]
MKKWMISLAAAPLMIAAMNTAAAAEESITILDDMKVSGEIRPRYEMAAVKDNGLDTANAFTARTRLAVEGTLFGLEGLSAKVGMTSVNNFGYNDYAPQDATYDLILDPQQAILTEGYLAYTAADTTLLAGRSFVNLDDQRFVGTVGWRQMERAYDTVTVVNKSVEGLTLLGAWVYGYQGVNTNPTTDTGSALLNVNYKAGDALTVSLFNYMLADIHDTYGIRLSGVVPVEGIKFDYAASYAMQTDATLDYALDTAPKIDASYYDVALGANISGLIAGAEYEVLGDASGSSTKGFTTPLATLHKFQGWADVFLGRTAGSNNDGLADLSVKLGYAAPGFGKVLGLYHKFDALSGVNKDLGSEFDVLYANKVPGVKDLAFLAKAAFYSKGDTGNDVTKAWLQLDYKFATK